MHIERALVARLGDVGRKMHTARSRNDQVATDLRLWDRDAIDQIDRRLLPNFSGRLSAAAMPTAIASCPATPTCSGPSRCWPRTIGWPIAKSSSAIASGWPIAGGGRTCCRSAPRRWPARRCRSTGSSSPQRLGFDAVAANSLDASSDRDFAIEFAFALVADRGASEHLGGRVDPVVHQRVQFSEAAAGVLHRLVDHAAEGQPRRAGADPRQDGPRGRQLADRCWCWSKGLPLAYNRDLQEDKPPLFDAFDTVSACLELAAPLVAGAELNREAIRSGSTAGISTPPR